MEATEKIEKEFDLRDFLKEKMPDHKYWIERKHEDKELLEWFFHHHKDEIGKFERGLTKFIEEEIVFIKSLQTILPFADMGTHCQKRHRNEMLQEIIKTKLEELTRKSVKELIEAFSYISCWDMDRYSLSVVKLQHEKIQLEKSNEKLRKKITELTSNG